MGVQHLVYSCEGCTAGTNVLCLRTIAKFNIVVFFTYWAEHWAMTSLTALEPVYETKLVENDI